MCVTFQEAATVFFDPLALTYPDPAHSADEQREVTIGHTMKQDLVFVSHTGTGDRIRIISARPATKLERRKYEEGIGEKD
jgi:uncharacterized DUF497 family protein